MSDEHAGRDRAVTGRHGPVRLVNTSGSTATLIGHARSRAERDAVVGAAWMGHGVMVVLDELEITG